MSKIKKLNNLIFDISIDDGERVRVTSLARLDSFTRCLYNKRNDNKCSFNKTYEIKALRQLNLRRHITTKYIISSALTFIFIIKFNEDIIIFFLSHYFFHNRK